MKFSFSTNAYRNFSVEDSIKSIANAGYHSIELMCDLPHAFPPLSPEKIQSIKKTLKENKMTISNLNGFMMCAIEDFHHPSWIEKDPIYRQKRIDHTKYCLDLAKDLGVDSISTEPGGPPTGLSREEELDIFEQGLNEVLPKAEENKIKLLIEPEPNLLIENSSQFLDFISRFNSDFIGLNFDVGHFFCVNEDPAELIITLKGFINHIHLEDIAQSRVHQHLVPGTGAIDFSRIFYALSEINYNGYITVELYPYLDNPSGAAQDALNFLNSVANVD